MIIQLQRAASFQSHPKEIIWWWYSDSARDGMKRPVNLQSSTPRRLATRNSRLPLPPCRVRSEYYRPRTLCRYAILRVERFANAVCHRSKAKLRGVFAHKHSDNPTAGPPQTRSSPPEIVEIVIAHLKHDAPTLKPCAATCFGR